MIGEATRERSDLLRDYAEHLAAVSVTPNPGQLAAARQLCTRFGGPTGFAAAPLDDQLAIPRLALRFVDWLIVTRQLLPSAGYVMARKGRVGLLFKKAHPLIHATFTD